MDLAELEKMVASPEAGPQAAYLAADMQRILPALADPARAVGAVAELSAWAAAPGDGLRKRFAGAFIEKARAALGGQSAESAISQFSKPFQPGGAIPKRGAVADRFGGDMVAPAHHPMPNVNGGGAGDHAGAPAPRVEQESKPADRLNAPLQDHTGPKDAPHPADAAHRSGARLAGLAAKHSFKLGTTAAIATGAAAGAAAGGHGGQLSDKQRAERSTASKARWDKLKRGGPAQPAPAPSTLGKLFGVHNLPKLGDGPTIVPDAQKWTCANCGHSHGGMSKAAPAGSALKPKVLPNPPDDEAEPQTVAVEGNASARARLALHAPTKQDTNGGNIQPAGRRCAKCGHSHAVGKTDKDAQPKTDSAAAVRWQSVKRVAGGK